jgi:hypothetical protein
VCQARPARSRRPVAGNAHNAAVTATDGRQAILIADPWGIGLPMGDARDPETAVKADIRTLRPVLKRLLWVLKSVQNGVLE